MELINIGEFSVYIYSHKAGVIQIDDVREMLCEFQNVMNSFVVLVAAIRGMRYDVLTNFFCLGSVMGARFIGWAMNFKKSLNSLHSFTY